MAHKDDIPELERRADADPDNDEAQLALVTARARREGAAVYLDPLGSLEAWRSSSDLLQDMAAQEVKRRLGADFEKPVFRLFRCQNRRKIAPQRVTLEHRIAVFRHKECQLDFHLIPGHPHAKQPLRPFLLAKHPITYRNIGTMPRALLGSPCPVDAPVSNLTSSEERELLDDWSFRLPSREEWAHAQKGGTWTRFYWGEVFDERYVLYSDNNVYGPLHGHPRSVKEREDRANAYGLVDMVGHVWERIESRQNVAGGGFLTTLEVLRDGSFFSYFPASRQSNQVGVRPALSVPDCD